MAPQQAPAHPMIMGWPRPAEQVMGCLLILAMYKT